jgi:hypothetical protein
VNLASALDELRGRQVAFPRFYSSLTVTNNYSASDSAAIPPRLEIEPLFKPHDSFLKGSDTTFCLGANGQTLNLCRRCAAQLSTIASPLRLPFLDALDATDFRGCSHVACSCAGAGVCRRSLRFR